MPERPDLTFNGSREREAWRTLGELLADPEADRRRYVSEEEYVALEERLEAARLVADHWRIQMLKDGITRPCAHPLCMVLDALAGETDPVKLGIEPGSDTARTLVYRTRLRGNT